MLNTVFKRLLYCCRQLSLYRFDIHNFVKFRTSVPDAHIPSQESYIHLNSHNKLFISRNATFPPKYTNVNKCFIRTCLLMDLVDTLDVCSREIYMDLSDRDKLFRSGKCWGINEFRFKIRFFGILNF